MTPELRVSVSLAVLAAAVMTLSSTASADAAPVALLPWGYAAVLPIALWTALAPRHPRLSVVAAPATTYAAYATVLPAFPDVLAVAVPLVYVALRGHLVWGVATAVVVTGLSSGYRLLVESGPALDVVVDVVRDSALMFALLLLGDSLRARRAARHEARLEAQLREGEHRARLAGQRLETARELHDVLAHTLTLVRIQTNVVEEALDDPERARDAVDALRRTSGDAQADLRGTIDLLRTADAAAGPSTAPAPGLGQVEQLVAGARESGLRIDLVKSGDLAEVRPALGLAAYRVVQEALTNTLRHAAAAAVEVRVERRDDGLLVRVADDGTPPAALVAGYGLRGMQERVRALQGHLELGTRSCGGGFAVTAWFPDGSDA